VRVVAPATNQSGTGEQYNTTSPLHVQPATTASGDAATSVAGFPADTVLYDVLGAHDRPDVVVSGSNLGQNLAEITEVSGTVGAARIANRLGIPAVAVSSGFGAPPDYATAARLTALIVDTFRARFEKHKLPAQTINVNVPTCAAGTNVRGVRLVPLGHSNPIRRYTTQAGSVDNGTFAPVVVTENPFAAANCAATATAVFDDIMAFDAGFASVTILNDDYTDPFSLRPPAKIWTSVDRSFRTSAG